jgi:hypothetical protein
MLAPPTTNGGAMSLRDDLQAVIRLHIAQTGHGDQAVQNVLAGKKIRGTSQDVVDMLMAYCGGLEDAVLALADEVETIRGGKAES